MATRLLKVLFPLCQVEGSLCMVAIWDLRDYDQHHSADLLEALDRLSNTITALRKSLRIHPSRRRIFQLYSIPQRAWPRSLRPATREQEGLGNIPTPNY
ncbi:hypothetical protein BDZ45DRAFT_302733 [Acephala macrosclerotiorum]|nr:hypothetical protein BDZ45DRAFT_302733 [Acephala macrosclerotiorum]